MAQDTLLGFPAHTFPYRRGEFTTLSTVSRGDKKQHLHLCGSQNMGLILPLNLPLTAFITFYRILQKNPQTLESTTFFCTHFLYFTSL